MSRRRSCVNIDDANSHSPLLGNHRDSLHARPANLLNDFHTIVSSTYANVLLIFVPFGIISGILEWSSSVVFTLNFFALIPLALLLSYSTKELSRRVGSTAGGLLNITFGNATELIVGVVALKNDQIRLIQTTMIGSILSTLLFVLYLFFLCLRLGTWIDLRSRGDTSFRIWVQWQGRADNEFVDVCGDRQFNPPFCI